MDSDRKYRQHGYFDSNSTPSNGNGNNGTSRPKPSGPRPPIDITGPRLPRLVQAVTASRCYNCSTTLPPDTAFDGAALLISVAGGNLEKIKAALIEAGASVRSSALVGSHATRYTVAPNGAAKP